MTQDTFDLLPALVEQLQGANEAVSLMWASSQAEHFSNYMPVPREDVDLSLFAHLLPATPARVLDLGCNNGEIVMALKARGYEACGVDLPQVVRKAIDTYYPYAWACLLRCNLEKDELPQGGFDLILALAVIEHIVNWKALLRKVHQALLPGGVFFLTSCDRSVVGREPWHWRHFTVDELLYEGLKAGFSQSSGVSLEPSLRITMTRGDV